MKLVLTNVPDNLSHRKASEKHHTICADETCQHNSHPSGYDEVTLNVDQAIKLNDAQTVVQVAGMVYLVTETTAGQNLSWREHSWERVDREGRVYQEYMFAR